MPVAVSWGSRHLDAESAAKEVVESVGLLPVSTRPERGAAWRALLLARSRLPQIAPAGTARGLRPLRIAPLCDFGPSIHGPITAEARFGRDPRPDDTPKRVSDTDPSIVAASSQKLLECKRRPDR